MSNYIKLKQGLEKFRELFERGLLAPRVVSGKENFLTTVRAKEIWTQSDAFKVYSIIKPFKSNLLKIGFNLDSIPPISTAIKPKAVKILKYRSIQKKLIGYDKEAFVVFFPYDARIVGAIRLIQGAEWKNEKKYWNVPLAKIKELRVFAERFRFKYTDKGRSMITNMAENYNASYKAEKVDLDLPMKLEPYPFQYAGIDYGMKNINHINADEMGLGKTPQGIGVALGLDAFPVLIICPKSLRLNWKNEWDKFSHKKAMILTKKNIKNFARYYELGMFQVAITNLEGARTLFTKEIHEIPITKGKRAGKTNKKIILHGYEKQFKCVILDEAHEARNEKTIMFKTIKPVMAAAETRICLTGSPIVKKTNDLASLLELIGRIDDFGGRYKFVRAYNKFKKSSFNEKVLPANLKELNIKLRSLCFIRREKDQVLKDLPEKTIQLVPVELSNREEYDEAFNAFRFWLDKQGYDEEKIDRAMRAEMLVKIGVLKRMSAKGKLYAFVDKVNEILDCGEKIVVFCWHKETANFINDYFDNVLLITGDVSDDDVEANKKKFQEDPKYKIIACTFKRGGVGHTLTAASKVIIIEPGWTYKDHSQAIDRVHRIGLKWPVLALCYIGVNTIDEDIYDVIEQRRKMEKDATGGKTELNVSISKRIAKKAMEMEVNNEDN